MLLPSGYTARLVATIDPRELASGVYVLEGAYPDVGTMFVLRVSLSARPDNIDQVAQGLSDAMVAAGVQSWLSPPAYADPVEPVIWATWIHSGTLPPSLEPFVETSLWQGLIPIILIIGAFVLIPALSELLELMVVMVVMFMMMNMLTRMMVPMRPELEPALEAQQELIDKAKRGVPAAYRTIRSLSDKGVGWAQRAWAEIQRMRKE